MGTHPCLALWSLCSRCFHLLVLAGSGKGRCQGGSWVFSPSLLWPLAWGMSVAQGREQEGQMAIGRTTGRGSLVPWSPRGGFCELQGSCKGGRVTHSWPGAFQGAVCPRTGPVALLEPPSSPSDTDLSLDRFPRPKKTKPCLRGVFPEQLHVCPEVREQDE